MANKDRVSPQPSPSPQKETNKRWGKGHVAIVEREEIMATEECYDVLIGLLSYHLLPLPTTNPLGMHPMSLKPELDLSKAQISRRSK